jgi:hypothetical protein
MTINDAERIIVLERRVSDLESTIANALAAMDEGRRGDARRILTTGKCAPIRSSTGVIAVGSK